MTDLLYTTPFESGWLAYERGLTINDCPFDHRNPAACIHWRNGWREHAAVYRDELHQKHLSGTRD